MANGFNNILVVCVGNVCRSPVGERLLQSKSPNLNVSSAGIAALVDHAADEDAKSVAADHGVDVNGHSARQFNSELAKDADLILVMESGHKKEIEQSYPHISGKIMLFDQWTGAKGIPDPFRMSLAFHHEVYQLIDAAADAWAQKLTR